MANTDISRVIVRTMDGLRVALAGLPAEMRVVSMDDTVEVYAATIAELRGLQSLPHALDVFVPYRLLGSSVIVIGRHEGQKDQT